jgi:hypothetical protein
LGRIIRQNGVPAFPIKGDIEGNALHGSAGGEKRGKGNPFLRGYGLLDPVIQFIHPENERSRGEAGRREDMGNGKGALVEEKVGFDGNVPPVVTVALSDGL